MVTPRSILVVDDEANARTALAELLSDEGYLVQTANDGLMALAKFAACPPDLVLTDIRMPGLDGLGLLRKVHEGHPDCPVILMSAHIGASKDLGASAGAAAILAKPLNFTELTMAIEQTLAAHGTHKQPSRAELAAK